MEKKRIEDGGGRTETKITRHGGEKTEKRKGRKKKRRVDGRGRMKRRGPDIIIPTLRQLTTSILVFLSSLFRD